MNDLLAKLAPLLGTAIAGPFGGIAASFLADKLGVPDKTVQAVTDAISDGKMTPDQVAQIKLAEIEFKKWMGDNALKQEQLIYDDKKSARDMQIATKSQIPGALAIFVTLGFFGILGALMYGQVQKSDALMVMLGSLGTAWTAIVSYYFGSSKSSQDKDLMLHNSTPT
jgi:hypothetical protein